jgi:hypothetical protein
LVCVGGMPAVKERATLARPGETEQKILHDGSNGGVVLCGPDASLAVGIVADGYGDVVHGCPPGLAGFWMVISIVRREREIICNPFALGRRLVASS